MLYTLDILKILGKKPENIQNSSLLMPHIVISFTETFIFFSCFSYTYEISTSKSIKCIFSTSKSIKCIFSYLSYSIKYSIQIKASGLVHNLIYTITSRMLNSRQTGCDVITQVCIPKKSFSS